MFKESIFSVKPLVASTSTVSAAIKSWVGGRCGAGGDSPALVSVSAGS